MTFAFCVARFYGELAARLEAGARGALPDDASVEVFDVPGAFELPAAAQCCAASGRFDAVVCLGAVIRGETDHYDYVCGEAARGIADVARMTGVPTSFGVLTVDTMEQALARSDADGGKRDSGAHAAEAVLALLAIKARLGAHPGSGPG